jgi:hypothetical protein
MAGNLGERSSLHGVGLHCSVVCNDDHRDKVGRHANGAVVHIHQPALLPGPRGLQRHCLGRVRTCLLVTSFSGMLDRLW